MMTRTVVLAAGDAKSVKERIVFEDAGFVVREGVLLILKADAEDGGMDDALAVFAPGMWAFAGREGLDGSA